jgi:hypothetical protein
MMNGQGETSQDSKSPATLLSKEGKPLASVTARLSPKLRSGDFRLPSSIDAHQILAKATNLQTLDGRQFQLLNLRICIAVHLMSPGQPHFEFDYNPEQVSG